MEWNNLILNWQWFVRTRTTNWRFEHEPTGWQARGSAKRHRSNGLTCTNCTINRGRIVIGILMMLKRVRETKAMSGVSTLSDDSNTKVINDVKETYTVTIQQDISESRLSTVENQLLSLMKSAMSNHVLVSNRNIKKLNNLSLEANL